MKANDKKTIFNLMWQFIKNNGYTRSEALKCAWANFKLKMQMQTRIVKFYFQKIDGTIREAFGTLFTGRIPATATESNRRKNDTIQTYFDTEKNEWRCYKKANLLRIA